MDVGFVAVVVLGMLVLGGLWYAQRLRVRRKEESLQRLLDRDPTLARTTTPCGMDARHLAGNSAVTPRGDRRSGVRWAVTGPLALELPGGAVEVECAAFQWWYEERRTHHDKHGTRTTYEERRVPVCVARLPAPVPGRIVVRPESLLGRVGLTRAGMQLESSEFNRRFRVDTGDRTLTVTLLDANLQQRMVEDFPDRTVEVAGDLLWLGGRPAHRDASLTGVIGDLPAMRQDVQHLARQVPAQFWRALSAGGGHTWTP